MIYYNYMKRNNYTYKKGGWKWPWQKSKKTKKKK